MAMREDMEKQGAFLFRWRSYVPMVILPPLILALFHSENIERLFGDVGEHLWEALCLLISLSGLALRAGVAGYVLRGTSGRNTKGQAAEQLNTTGMYSIVRNPLYLGNFVIMLGALMFVQVWWLVLIGVFGFLFYYERIIFTEEEFLRKKFGKAFLDWAQRTPVFYPDFKRWQRPDLPFSFKTVLRREYSTFFGIIASFTFIDIAADLATERKLEIKPFWVVLFVGGLVVYLTLMAYKKKTKRLNVAGR